MKNNILLLLFLLSGKFVTAQYAPVSVTNYKIDGVAENTTAIANTSGGLDAGGNVLISANYASLFTPTSTGLPNSGTIVNGLDTYQMAAYTQSNVLQILTSGSDSLLLTNPASYMGLSIMNFASDGAANMALTVRFTDNTIQTFASTSVQDWFNGTGAVISGFDRAARSTGALAYASGNPRFYSSNVYISCANRTKQIKTLKFTNSASGKLNIVSVSAVVPPVYTASVTPIPCSGSTGSISILTSGGIGTNTYSWSTSPVQTAATATGLASGSYNYTVTDVAGCVYTSTTAMPTNTGVIAAPVILPYTNPICSGFSLAVTAIGAASYTWTGGISNNVAFTPTASTNPQVYSYTVTGANSCSTSTASTAITLTVNPNPTITATSSSPSVCTGGSISLNGGGASSSYTWSAGVSNATTFTPATTNTYVVSGSNIYGCFASAATVVTVVITPTLSPVSSPAYLCIGGSATLSATGASNYTWLPGNSTASSIVVNPTSSTGYTVIKANSTCVDTKTILLTVYALPTVQAVSSTNTVCAGSLATLNAVSSTATNYTWVPSAGTSSVAFVSPLNNTTYTLTVFNGTCSAQATIALSTVPVPTITSTVSNSVICAGNSVTLSAAGGVSYTWNPGGIASASAVVSPTAPIQYSVTASNSLGCYAGSSQVVIVNSSPTLTVSQSDQTICNGNPATLSVSGGNTYTWSTSSSFSTIVVNPAVTTIYTVDATGSNSCTGTQTLQVAVFDPTVSITSPSAICSGQTATLTASGAATYTWDGFYTQPSYIVTPGISTVYSLSATSNSSSINCVTNSTVQVTVNPLPTVTAVASRTAICKNETTIITASGASTYSWNTNASTNTISITSSVITVLNYSVIGTNAFGCSNTATVSVKINSCNGLQEYSSDISLLIYPNPSKGNFCIQSLDSKDVKISVSNSLGQLLSVHELNGENAHKISVSNLTSGIYFINETGVGNNRSYKVLIEN